MGSGGEEGAGQHVTLVHTRRPGAKSAQHDSFPAAVVGALEQLGLGRGFPRRLGDLQLGAAVESNWRSAAKRSR